MWARHVDPERCLGQDLPVELRPDERRAACHVEQERHPTRQPANMDGDPGMASEVDPHVGLDGQVVPLLGPLRQDAHPAVLHHAIRLRGSRVEVIDGIDPCPPPRLAAVRWPAQRDLGRTRPAQAVKVGRQRRRGRPATGGAEFDPDVDDRLSAHVRHAPLEFGVRPRLELHPGPRRGAISSVPVAWWTTSPTSIGCPFAASAVTRAVSAWPGYRVGEARRSYVPIDRVDEGAKVGLVTRTRSPATSAPVRIARLRDPDAE